MSLLLVGWTGPAQAEVVMKVLIVNPSESEAKEFRVRSPLPPEIRPEHVLETDGLQVEYDSQSGSYVLVGTVTLKPKESLSKRVLLEDVWRIDGERLTTLRNEASEILRKLEGTPYRERGQLLAEAMTRRLDEIQASQDQAFLPPEQHIDRYHEHVKALQLVESDLVSLRQLMVMALLGPARTPGLGEAESAGAAHERGGLSILATWQLIFLILALLGFVSLSFFLVWQRQLKLQLAKQAGSDDPSLARILGDGKTNGAKTTHGSHAPTSAGVPSSVTSRLTPKTPLSS